MPVPRHSQPRYLPRRSTIAALCQEIQSGWSDDEELRRRTDHHLNSGFGSGAQLAEDAARALIPVVADADVFADLPMFEPPIEL